MFDPPLSQRMRASCSGHLARFGRNENGSVAILFAAAAMALSVLVAGGIEMHRRNLALALMQKAGDSAALAAKRAEAEALLNAPLGEAHATGEQAGRAMFDAVIAENRKVFGNVPPAAAFSWLKDDSVKVSVSGQFESMFGSLMPSSLSNVGVDVTVNYGVPLPTEVALVLDNTASMFSKDSRPQSRFTQLRDASKMFTHQLFNAAEQSGSNDWLRISVVPWAATVNIRSEAPRPSDSSGNAPVSSIPDYGTKKPLTGPLDRSGNVKLDPALFAPVGWRGCISGGAENPNPSAAGPIVWDALNVPNNALAQTTVQQGRIQPVAYQECTYKTEEYDCPVVTTTTTSTSYSPPPPPPPPPPPSSTSSSSSGGMQGLLTDPLQSEAPVMQTSFFGDRFKDAVATPAASRTDPSSSSSTAKCTRQVVDKCVTKYRDQLVCNLPSKVYNSCAQDIAGGRRNVFMAKGGTCVDPVGGCILANTETVRNVGPCVADPNEWGWKGAWCPWVPATDWTKFDATIGPNLNCPVPMLGLSGNRKQILETIDRMTPVSGGTHVDVGLRWGMRTLTPTSGWDKFFGLDKPPVAFGGKEQKLMILITDGENQQAIDYPGYWNCKGYVNPGCSGGAPDQAELDRRTMAWCEDIKTKNSVDLFTIAVNFSPKAAAAAALLERCASPPKGGVKRFYRIDASELKNVLNIIASQVIRLRITT